MRNPRTFLAIIIAAASRELKTLLANRFVSNSYRAIVTVSS